MQTGRGRKATDRRRQRAPRTVQPTDTGSASNSNLNQAQFRRTPPQGFKQRKARKS